MTGHIIHFMCFLVEKFQVFIPTNWAKKKEDFLKVLSQVSFPANLGYFYAAAIGWFLFFTKIRFEGFFD